MNTLNKKKTIKPYIEKIKKTSYKTVVNQLHLQSKKKELTKTQKNNIERCNDLYVNEDEAYMKRLYNESELVVLNNS